MDDEPQLSDIEMEPPPSAQSQEEIRAHSQHNQEVEAFHGLWWKCIKAMDIETEEALWVSKSVAQNGFMRVLRSVCNYLVTRMNAENVQGTIRVDKNQTMAAIQVIGFQTKAYRQGACNPEIFMAQCTKSATDLDAERSRIKHLIVMRNQRHKKDKTEKEVRLDHLGISKQWYEVDCRSVQGRLSPEELAHLAEAVRQLGRVHLDSWCKTLGLGIELHAQQTLLPIMEQVCAVFPVAAVKRKHSKRDI